MFGENQGGILLSEAFLLCFSPQRAYLIQIINPINCFFFYPTRKLTSATVSLTNYSLMFQYLQEILHRYFKKNHNKTKIVFQQLIF